MKLEDKFFKSFFYPFVSGAFLSTLIVVIFLSLFTNNNYDKRTSEIIINSKKDYSKLIINSANILLTTKFQKFQSSLNELILLYQNISTKILQSKKYLKLNNTYLKSTISLGKNFCKNMPEGTEHMVTWLLDNQTSEENIDNKIDVKNQLIAFSNIIQNIETVLDVNKPDANYMFFYFDKTELYLSFPLKYDCQDYWIDYLTNPQYEKFNNHQCLDEKGEYYSTYKVKCDEFFTTIMQAKTGAFDNNYLTNKNKSIFISNYYGYSDYQNFEVNTRRDFRICIEFYDPITQGKGYICIDAYYEDIIDSLEDLNNKIDGYYFISNIGFNHVFYFPQGTLLPQTATENIYQWGKNYFIKEKSFFHEHIRKIMSSSYIDYINNTINSEVFVNGKNSSDQYFYVNNIKLKYSIFPLILENLKGQKEHVMSLIYIYKEELFFEEINEYTSSIVIKIILELLIFIIFGYGLFYIVISTFNTLVKHIVIPIQNVNYMLKGINIGGNNRLNYLNFLKKKRDENTEQLENNFLFENNINKSNDEFDNKNNNKNNNNYNDNDDEYFINKEKETEIIEKIKKYSDFNEIYDKESIYIEKENTFYDFDEQLLQYRPLEIENLMKSLMDIKTAMLLTSKDREINQIIDYSHSEKIFKNFKNKEGAIICQSNIGNMQSQLLKFDKAIYHLVQSLQDNKLKKFLEQNLNDEFDENDSLLNKISNTYNKNKKIEKKNILVEKQINNSKNNFSQKIIGILINTRYCRLIHAYYMFFKNMKKMQKSIDDIKNGQFLNSFYHTIDYYHKILIQYIFLCYVKNDLIKIGESILNYIEFLLKFKLKLSEEDKYIFKIDSINRPEFSNKINYKKKIFNKIIKWFNLFDDYISHVKSNSSLGNIKSIINDYSHNLNNNNLEYNIETQTAILFKINIQKSNFLRGKFCFYCKNYNDALFFFISVAKSNTIVIDGLIKKRSLKHIYKILTKLNKKYEQYGLINLNMEKKLKEIKKEKNRGFNKKIKIGRKSTNRSDAYQNIEFLTFKEEIKIIKDNIIKDISECNEKQEKDILILIDFNIYNKIEKNLDDKLNKINSFIEETKLIINNYLSINDRLCVLIYSDINYKIICPLIYINELDKENFSKDLINYKNKIFNEKNEIDNEYYNINLYELKANNITEQSQEDSFEISDKEENNYDKIKGLVKTINFLNCYSKMKQGIKNEKYFIIFSDIINHEFNEDENIEKIFKKLRGDKDIIFILVGKNKKFNFKKEKNDYNNNNTNIIEELFLNKFGDKSEIIEFENMKKIKTVLSNNKVIKEEIFYPNEIYK